MSKRVEEHTRMMVGPYGDEQLLLVMQTDHSRVAGFFAAHWGNDAFARLRPYASMVIAAQEHDGGWADWELKPTLNKQGRPLDYIGSTGALGAVWLSFYRRGVERVTLTDRYAAYFVSMHGDGLVTKGMGLLQYMPNWASVFPPAQAFVDEQHVLRARLLEELREDGTPEDLITKEHLWMNYKYMEVFDQMAQFTCNRHPFNSTVRQNGPSRTLSDVPVPVAPGEDDTHLLVDVRDESHAIVTPYPFDIDPLVISFEGRLVPDRTYQDQGEFLPYFYNAPRVQVTYSMHSS